MILADKITEERKKNGWSQEELANQLGVSRQAVSKWESAGAVPDLQRILQMSELFCVSTDYLLKDEMKAENITYHESTESYAEPLKKVTMENANEFLDMKRNGSKVVANATSMCISSPILLIVLVTMAEDGVFHVSESLATVFGCVFLLGMVAAAVFLFILSGKTGSRDSTGLRKPNQMADQPVAGNPGVYYDRYDDTGYLAGKTGQTDPLFRGRISEPEYLSPSAFSLSNLYLRSVKFRD